MTSVPALVSSEAEVVAKLFLHGCLDSKKSLYALIRESEKVLGLPAEFLHEFRKDHGTVTESEFKKLCNLGSAQQRIRASALSLSETDAGSTTASCSSDEEFSDRPETWSQNSSSTCTPRKADDEISDQSCFEETDNESYQGSGKIWKKQRCKYINFEPSQQVSSQLIDLLKTSCPRSPKCGSGWRPRSAGSVQSCVGSTQPRPASVGSTQPRPASAPCRARPTSANSTQSGTPPQQRIRPASATLGSLSKSWMGNPCSSGSPKVPAKKGEGRPRSVGSLVPATSSGSPEEKSNMCSNFRCVEWRSLAMPIWKKQRN